MTCSACGFQQSTAATFCSRCGARAYAQASGTGAAPWMPLTPPPAFEPEQKIRVGQNLQSLGVLWCMYGGYRMLRVLAAYFAWETFGRTALFGDAPPFVGDWVTAAAPILATTALFWAGLSIVAGLGLLARRSWARPLTIVLGIFSLIKLPVGTALGIYTLWVLAPSAAGEEWRRIQRA